MHIPLDAFFYLKATSTVVFTPGLHVDSVHSVGEPMI